MKKLKNSEGFTLMEMLIVVAIIAILVAILLTCAPLMLRLWPLLCLVKRQQV